MTGVSDPDLRAVMHRFPHGVAVVTVDAQGQQVGLTVSSLISLSIEPPLVGFAVARQAAIHELLLEAGAFAVSLLAEGQEGPPSTSRGECHPSSTGAGSTGCLMSRIPH